MKVRGDLTGQRFGRLVVEQMIPIPGCDTRARCHCDCGRAFEGLAYNIRNGNTSSCGCLAFETRSSRGKIMGWLNATHGMSQTRTYKCWLDARKRCFRPQNKRFPDYGGRGITMCSAWASSFESFLQDMGEAPEKMTLERERVDGNYEPSNCSWATRAQQARNTRANKATWPIVREIRRRVAVGELKAALAREFGMSRANVDLIASGATWKE